MAQELVLIPKDEYESLLTNKKMAKVDDVLDPEEPNADYSLDRKDKDSENMVQQPISTAFSAPIKGSSEKNLKSATNVPEAQLQMKGSGKTYVKQSIEKFLKLASRTKSRNKRNKGSRSKKNLIRKRWIHYK